MDRQIDVKKIRDACDRAEFANWGHPDGGDARVLINTGTMRKLLDEVERLRSHLSMATSGLAEANNSAIRLLQEVGRLGTERNNLQIELDVIREKVTRWIGEEEMFQMQCAAEEAKDRRAMEFLAMQESLMGDRRMDHGAYAVPEGLDGANGEEVGADVEP